MLCFTDWPNHPSTHYKRSSANALSKVDTTVTYPQCRTSATVTVHLFHSLSLGNLIDCICCGLIQLNTVKDCLPNKRLVTKGEERESHIRFHNALVNQLGCSAWECGCVGIDAKEPVDRLTVFNWCVFLRVIMTYKPGEVQDSMLGFIVTELKSQAVEWCIDFIRSNFGLFTFINYVHWWVSVLK